jgi:hypothetical protein
MIFHLRLQINVKMIVKIKAIIKNICKNLKYSINKYLIYIIANAKKKLKINHLYIHTFLEIIEIKKINPILI